MTTRTSARAGFTLVETMVTLTLGTLLVGAMLSVLMGNNRLSNSLTGRAEANDALRTGMAVLEAELEPIDASDGDLASLSPDTLRVRSFLGSGTACGVTYGTGTADIVVRKQGRWLSSGDSLLIMADNDPAIGSDDVWVRGAITAVDTAQACPDSVPAQRITVPALAALTDSVRVGAAARTFEWRSYFLAAVDGAWYLSTLTPALTSPEPVAGPLADPAVSPGGLRVTYFNAFGQPAANPQQVTQMEIVLKAIPRVGTQTQALPDSAMTWVRLR